MSKSLIARARAQDENRRLIRAALLSLVLVGLLICGWNRGEAPLPAPLPSAVASPLPTALSTLPPPEPTDTREPRVRPTDTQVIVYVTIPATVIWPVEPSPTP